METTYEWGYEEVRGLSFDCCNVLIGRASFGVHLWLVKKSCDVVPLCQTWTDIEVNRDGFIKTLITLYYLERKRHISMKIMN